jgi:hypothetical protein
VTATRDWRTANAEWLGASLRVLRLRLERLAVADRAVGRTRLADWLVAGDPQDEISGTARPEVSARLDTLDRRIELERARLAAWADENIDEARNPARPPALLALSEAAGLSQFETDVLLLAAATSLDGAFAGAFAEVQGDSRLDRPTLNLAMRLYRQGAERILGADVLLHTRPLRRLNLVNGPADGPDAEPRLLCGLAVDERLSDYLRGVNLVDDRLVAYLAPLMAPDSDPPADSSSEALASRLLPDGDRWPTLNVLAPADAGSLQVVAAATRRAGVMACLLDVPRLAELDVATRRRLIGLLGREALLTGLGAIVDATALDAHGAEARVVDELVATLNAPLVIVSHERWPSQGGALERVTLGRPTRTEQQRLWRHALARHPNTVNGELDAIVQQFDFGPAAIEEAVDRAALAAPELITGRGLWDAARSQVVPPMSQLARRIEAAWGWDDIVVDADTRGQLRELSDQVQNRSQVYEAWGFGARLGRGRGITALFAGPSGTGKTMAAEIIAGQLRLDLYRVDLAGVVSKYVGETEKNLRRVFDAAESSGAILLFDEADALFGTRTEVRDSHDRYANLEINYLLQAMEDYQGLAILATNRRSALDGAFVRRLRFIVEFPFPDGEARRQIWERAFPARAALDDLDLGFLSRLELSGGSIRAIAINAAFLAAAKDKPIGMSHVVRAAAREYGKLARPIGSAEFGNWLAVARQ